MFRVATIAVAKKKLWFLFSLERLHTLANPISMNHTAHPVLGSGL